jgi:hypothetical protein
MLIKDTDRLVAALAAFGAQRKCAGVKSNESDANDVVDGARSAASKCHRVVASKRTTLRGAVHG